MTVLMSIEKRKKIKKSNMSNDSIGNKTRTYISMGTTTRKTTKPKVYTTLHRIPEIGEQDLLVCMTK